MPAQTRATWPGVSQTAGFSFTVQPGVKPSTCRLQIRDPRRDISPRGDLVLSTTGGPNDETLTFYDCAVDRAALQRDGSGFIWTLPIRDRRWKWQFGSISGDYNVAKGGGYVREKTPRELALLLFEAFGETGADVSRLPNDSRPRRRWEHANPASELESLCLELGCMVCLNFTTNVAEVWPIGEGRSLPTQSSTGQGYALEAKAKPTSLELIGGRTLFEATLDANTAVGLDVDGVWKAIDFLSYRPALGWELEPPSMPNVTGTHTAADRVVQNRELALATVWKNYRITNINGGISISPPLLQGTDLAPVTVDDLALESARATYATGLGGQPERLPHYVFAGYWDTGGTLAYYPGGSTIDAQNGLVRFAEPMYNVEGGTMAPATVRVTTAFAAGRDGLYHHYRRTQGLGDPGTEAEVVRRPDLVQTVVYADNITDNVAELDAEADSILTAAADAYEVGSSGGINYGGLAAVSPDGLTRQVTWRGGGGSLTSTEVSLARGHAPGVVSWEEQQRRRRAAMIVDRAIKLGEAFDNSARLKDLVERGGTA